MKFFQKLRDAQAKKERERKARLDKSEKEAETELQYATLNMLSAPCAINGMSTCKSACVHWRKGHVSFWPSWDDTNDGKFYAVRPSCRLWGEK